MKALGPAPRENLPEAARSSAPAARTASGAMASAPDRESARPAGRPRVPAWRAWLRTLAIVWALAIFAAPLLLDLARARRAARRGEPGDPEALAGRLGRHGARLRACLVGLGPTFIKVGQMLATRADLLPVAFLHELQVLHDDVPAFPDRAAFDTVERATGRPLGALFAEISEGPIAAASLGQVYRARLRSNGRVVAVKVRRPGLERRAALDLASLRRVAAWVEALERRRARFPALGYLRGEWAATVDEFERVLFEEMDYRLEGANAARFKANFASWPDVHVPEVLHHMTTERLLVMEFVEGIKVTDVERMRAAGLDPRTLNELLYRTYFKQLFEDGFFHADPHPGNLLAMRDGRLTFFDFGMVGRLDAAMQGKMVTAFFHLLDRDVDGIVQDLVDLEFLDRSADLTGFHELVAEVMARRLEVKLSEVKFREIVYDLAPIVLEYPITTPAEFTFLIRALMTLEGISVVMNPDFNFFDVARPYARRFLVDRATTGLRRQIADEFRDARSGRVDWSRMWRLAKAAYSLYASDR